MRKEVIVVVVLVAALLLCGIVAAGEFTMQINGKPYQNIANPVFTWGDKIQFSGMNTVSDAVYLSLGELPDNLDWTEPNSCKGLAWNTKGTTHNPIKGESWSYQWNTGDPACKYPNVDTTLQMEVWEAGMPITFPIIMKAVPVPISSPTPDYDAKIAALEAKVSTQSTQIQELAIKTPVPTTSIKIPIPTQTEDYDAKIAALQKQIDEQNSIIYQILHFLGLR